MLSTANRRFSGVCYWLHTAGIFKQVIVNIKTSKTKKFTGNLQGEKSISWLGYIEKAMVYLGTFCTLKNKAKQEKKSSQKYFLKFFLKLIQNFNFFELKKKSPRESELQNLHGQQVAKELLSYFKKIKAKQPKSCF